jgi:hypothetical protein
MYYRCPPTPFEVAGQLDLMLKAKKLREKSEITVLRSSRTKG